MNNFIDIKKIDWKKMQDLIPTVVQDVNTLQVLMLGYMNQTALQQTLETKKVIFYSRSKERLWEKGETSGNFLQLMDIKMDCDNDALLILAKPTGPTCHLQNPSCFGDEIASGMGFLAELEATIEQRYRDRPVGSYTSQLFDKGIDRIAQKVGEESVEVVIAATTKSQQNLINESADLLYHLLVLLKQSDLNLSKIIAELRNRHQNMT